MNPGDTVRWWRKRGGWAFGTVTKSGPTWTRVRLASNQYQQVRTDSIKAWPPEKTDTKPTRAKRGRN